LRTLAVPESRPETWIVLHRLLADAVLLVHAAFVAFVVLGGFWVLSRPKLAWVHLPIVAWGAGIELLGGICPLTPLEDHYRRLAGEQGLQGGFIEHYLLAALYPEGLTRGVQVALGIFVLVVNAAIYAAAWRRAARRRTSEQG
jgi:hypothetical protein